MFRHSIRIYTHISILIFLAIYSIIVLMNLLNTSVQELPMLRIDETGEITQDIYVATEQDVLNMDLALVMGKRAITAGENPIGAVVSTEGSKHGYPALIGSNTTEIRHDDLTEHAEINAYRLASKIAGRRLRDATMYTTAEPCLMCSYIIGRSEITTLFVATDRDETGFFRKRNLGMIDVLRDSGRPIDVIQGLRKAEALSMLRPKNRK